jgi:hypothetical protein
MLHSYLVSGSNGGIMDDEIMQSDSVELSVSDLSFNIQTKPLVRKKFPETWIWSDILTRFSF